MDELRVQRRLVKSPPELWAEVSDAEALSRHLDLFGEIRISRLEPESTVAWEGERASGTVVLDSAGWGTKVTLTAEVREPERPAQAPQQVTGDPTPVAATEQAGGPAVTKAAVAPAPPEPAPVARARRRPGLLARLFRRPAAHRPQAHAEPEVEPVAAERAGIAPPPALAAAPVEPAPAASVPEPEPEPALAADAAVTALEHVLDTLGAAHHRPFSR